jgi:hypothetical protein
MDAKEKARNIRLDRIFRQEPNIQRGVMSGELTMETLPAANIFKFVGEDRGYIRKIDPKLNEDKKETKRI